LANVSGTNIHTLGSQDIGFRLGPRLNAAGRLDSAAAAFEILMAASTDAAGKLALELDQKNKERQAITRDIQAAIEGLYDPVVNQWMLFFWDEAFNAGVVGLAASRLVEKFYRPAIVGVKDGDVIRASCRSIEQLNITDALDECADLLLQHGGHSMAAGLSVAIDKLDPFIAQFSKVCEQKLSRIDEKGELINEIAAEGVVELPDLLPETLDYYDLLEPIGNGNPFPMFVSRDVKARGLRQIGQEGSHLRFTVTDGKLNFDAVAFRFGEDIDKIANAEKMDILYAYELNIYNGRKNLQLRVEDIDLGEEGKDSKIEFGEIRT
jgi:single-stranded-DNA-specific exonuclease